MFFYYIGWFCCWSHLSNPRAGLFSQSLFLGYFDSRPAHRRPPLSRWALVLWGITVDLGSVPALTGAVLLLRVCHPPFCSSGHGLHGAPLAPHLYMSGALGGCRADPALRFPAVCPLQLFASTIFPFMSILVLLIGPFVLFPNWPLHICFLSCSFYSVATVSMDVPVRLLCQW